MKKIAVLFLLAYSLISSANPNIKGLHCGTRGTLIGTIASDFLIPDYFPPESILLRMLLAPLIDLSICEDLGTAHLGDACMGHDQCYQTLGAPKDSCDENLFMGWLDACSQRYQAESLEMSSLCLDICSQTVDFMYTALRYDDGNFCPSCIAYEKSQAHAQESAAQESKKPTHFRHDK